MLGLHGFTGRQREQPETGSNHHPNDASKDGSSYEIGEPMDGHRDADPDVERVNEGEITDPSVLGEQREYGDCHRKGDGGMRGGPAPEYPAAQKPESENMGQVGPSRVGRMDASGKGLVRGGDDGANHLGLRNGPSGKGGPSGAPQNPPQHPKQNEKQRQNDWQERANADGGEHEFAEGWRTGGEEIAPVRPGFDEQERNEDGHCVPDDFAALEAIDDVLGECQKELFHFCRRGRKESRINEVCSMNDEEGRTNSLSVIHPSSETPYVAFYNDLDARRWAHCNGI